jgi:prevent-host-death family protein
MEAINILGTYDAKTRFSELIERVAGGEEFTITRHGLPIARLVPVKRKSTSQERRAAVEAMREIAARTSLGGLKIKDLINEGRP